MPRRRSVILALVLVGAGALLGYLAAAGAIGSGAARPEAGATPVKVASRAVTGAGPAAAAAEATAAAKLGAPAARRLLRQTVKTRVSRQAIRTQPNKGSFIGLTCPRGYVALSGGAVTGFSDLLISHSAPIKPTGRQRYTPRTWWVAVTNIPVDGSTSALPWRPVVNCVNRLKVGS